MNGHDCINRVRAGRVVLALAILAITTSLTSGQTSRDNARRSDQAPDIEARRHALATDDRRTAALLRGDAAPLRDIYADDYTLVTLAAVIQNKSDQINDLTSRQLHYAKIDVVERTARVYGDDVIILSREKTDIVRAGQQVGGDVRVTRVYRKFGTEWRVIATHASAVTQ